MQPTRIVDMGSRSMSPKLRSDTPRSFGRIPSTRTWGCDMLVTRSMATNRVFWKGAICRCCSEGRFAGGDAVGWWRPTVALGNFTLALTEICSCNIESCMAAGVAALAVSCTRFRYSGVVPAQDYDPEMVRRYRVAALQKRGQRGHTGL
jgi:hypothetical protein